VLRNSDGYLVEHHPHLDKAIEGWIAEENNKTAQLNAKFRTMWNEYVANYKDSD
jgi:hypothetical protein